MRAIAPLVLALLAGPAGADAPAPAAAAAATPAAPCPVPIEGQWQSDGARSADFNLTHTRLEPGFEPYARGIAGHTRVHFAADGALSVRMADVVIEHQGEEVETIDGFAEDLRYRVLHCDGHAITVLQEGELPPGKVVVYQVVAPDLVWYYLGTTHPGQLDFHLREYLRRVP